MFDLDKWRETALSVIRHAESDILAAESPQYFVMLWLGPADLANDRPVEIAANVSADVVHRITSYAAFRMTLNGVPKKSTPADGVSAQHGGHEI